MALAALSGCSSEPGRSGFDVQAVNIQLAPRQLQVAVQQDASLSQAARQALNNGVALVVLVDAEVRDSRSLTLLATHQHALEIRYLPLSEHYQLQNQSTDPASSKTFPRLRHVMAELGRIRLSMATGPLAPGDYEFRVRISIDRSSLPMPMQLPAALMPGWRLDSDWTQWPFKVSA